MVNRKIYVANNGNNTISRANLDGTGAESLGNFAGGLRQPSGIALDVAGGKMYVVNTDNNAAPPAPTIFRANLNGTASENLGDLGFSLSAPRGIALDLTTRRMYVVNSANNSISRADLDGTTGIALGTLNGALISPDGITLDVAAGVMYVTNTGNHTIARGNLNGSFGTSLGNFGGTLFSPSGIALGPEPSIVTPPVGAPPIVDAGDDQTLTAGALGSALATLGATITPAGPGNYLWTDDRGNQLTDQTFAISLVVGVHTFTVTAIDAAGISSLPDSVTVTVLPLLSGLKGDKGDKGDTGDTGPEGPPGPPGDMGPMGPPGEIGPTGLTGLQGERGLQGDSGTAGTNGAAGLQGEKGDKGDRGPVGISEPGIAGPKGDPGTAGTNGAPGLPGTNGATGPTGAPGLPGQGTETEFIAVNMFGADRDLPPPVTSANVVVYRLRTYGSARRVNLPGYAQFLDKLVFIQSASTNDDVEIDAGFGIISATGGTRTRTMTIAPRQSVRLSARNELSDLFVFYTLWQVLDDGAGLPGIQGLAGATGATGLRGIQGPPGATGPQGAPGLSGLIRVMAERTVEGNSSVSFRAICPTGLAVISGGFAVLKPTGSRNNPDDMRITRSFPAVDRWEVWGHNAVGGNNRSLTLRAFALCAIVQ